MVKTGQQLALLVKKDNEDRVVLEKLKPYEIWLQQTKQKGVLI